VEALLATEVGQQPDTLVRQAVRANIQASANHLRDVLAPLIRNDELLVVGAEYSLESGIVEFFDGAPRLTAMTPRGIK
jgi:carbonic anhydrase